MSGTHARWTVIAAIALAAAGCASNAAEKPAPAAAAQMRVGAPPGAPPVAPGHEDVTERWGVEIVGPMMSAQGYMVDFRFRVVDPKKALPLLVHDAPAYMYDQKSGARLTVPAPAKVGRLRQTSVQAEAGRTYWVLFWNPALAVHSGDKVTVIIGDFRAQDLVVQ